MGRAGRADGHAAVSAFYRRTEPTQSKETAELDAIVSGMGPGLLPGTVLDGKYRIGALIGRGGMGAVYAGEDLCHARPVAIKVLHPDLALERRVVDRFEREARATATIGTPHVALILEFGELPSGDRYMVMEHLVGQSLAERLASAGTLPPERVVAIAAQLLDGLSTTHEAGIVHRDLKPANIFLVSADGGADFVKILDFGICKFRAPGEAQWTTVGSTVLGTPGYLSPEQLTDDEVGTDADLYAVGVIIYRCVAGRLPYDAATKAELLLHIRDGLRIQIEDLVPEIDPSFATLVMKGVAPDPRERFTTARDYRQALLEWLSLQGATLRLVAPPAALPEDGASTRPVLISEPSARPTPAAGTEAPGRAAADSPATIPPPASKTKAIVVGAAVGVATALSLYAALR
jgi:serine/threonine-protein kinase